MPATVLERALRLFPRQVRQRVRPDRDELDDRRADPETTARHSAATIRTVRARLTSVGRPVPGIDVEVRGDDGGPVASGEAGELWVRGPQVSGVYEGIGSVLDADGWFPTRDRGRVDAGGYLFIEGRADDTIIRGGENIAPAEIEDVLIRHPAHRDAAVVGLPDEEWGERIVAAVVPLEGAPADPDEIRAFVRARLRGSRTPDNVVIRDSLPYSPTGKLLRREIVADLFFPAAVQTSERM